MKTIIVGNSKITISDLLDVAHFKAKVQLSTNPDFIDKINSSRNFLEQMFIADGVIYGVTTGYGDSCTRSVSKEQVFQLPIHLIRYHSCGLGDFFNETETRAILFTRLSSLVSGYSGVSFELLEQLVKLLNHNILPRIPKEGSVGASGDLTPLAYVGATLIGEGEVLYQQQICSAQEILFKLNLKPIQLQPKEGLALMNGTAVMTALASLAFSRAEYLCKLASRITAINSIALLGNPDHFNEKLFLAKPHPGQAQVAKWIRNDHNLEFQEYKPERLQDRYSIRCAPHVIGVLQDVLPFNRQFIETEMNSANDNPLIDLENKKILHGGNFYGGHIAFVMDSMKTLIANIADLLDRQMALLVDSKFNNGLPANLSGASLENSSLNHGLKAVQISASAWTAEALKLTLPASIFSRSTECHNQDKVSMGTIAARDCVRVLELTEQVTAATLIASLQAIELRQIQNPQTKNFIAKHLKNFFEEVKIKCHFISDDRPLDKDLRRLCQSILQQEWELYCDK